MPTGSSWSGISAQAISPHVGEAVASSLLTAYCQAMGERQHSEGLQWVC
jgi:hypothetical protein